ncbi:MAG: HAD-IIA family hydrolase [Clostridia bacterium]|nr:HAD-IIA family hydrolase [Clostridia bacterium]
MTNSIKNKKLFLLDLDGTVYIEDRLIDGALEFFDHVKKSGGKYMFLTNNSSRGIKDYIKKFARLGINADKDDFVTSVQVASRYLHDYYSGKKVYVLGNKALMNELASDGHLVTDSYSDDVGILLVGYDTELTYQKIKDACRLLNKNVAYIATNPDLICPSENGYVPECGAFVEMLRLATGKQPTYVGKPAPEMIELAIEKSGIPKSDAVMIGDRLYTDIASGVNADVDTALVLSGEGTVSDIEASDKKPTFIYKNIREIYNILAG